MPIYDAFISYSHAKDKPIAAALHSAVRYTASAPDRFKDFWKD